MAAYSDSVRDHIRYQIKAISLVQLKANRRAVRQIRNDNIAANRHPLDRDEAETIANRYFGGASDTWIRAVGWLHGQSYVNSYYYYNKELPAQIAAKEAAETAKNEGINVAQIIAKELGDDPDLPI